MKSPVPLDRHEKKIKELEAYPVEADKVLLYGSSFFTNWGVERATEQWSSATNGALQIVNHGFGGATVSELLHYYDRLVLDYKPCAIVFRTGINDVKHGLSATQTKELTEELFDRVQSDFPGIKMIAIKVFDTTAVTEEEMNELRRYNDMLDTLTQKYETLYTVDLNPFFYKSTQDIGTRKNFRNVFVEDGLHLTDSGYEQMADYLAPKVKDILFS